MSFIVMGLCEDCFKSNVKIDSCQLYCNAEWLQSMVKY